MPLFGNRAEAFSFVKFEHFDALLSVNTGVFRLTGEAIERF
jgi:hypothetical protein